ncbi:DUF4373 domain-containing protein [Peribacillus simplex]|uniref:Lin1244/Lin1753-like N-terminal domain-containing protein n=1 Tax=Peribacillus simplex TaxID=1478 RepID=A0A9W4KY69_9BACI|nr:DUF4373 domain-containing protein [Peribacillus simplex]CAH0187121.1 hypothetical protein SRABI133_01573 [Peribacillus simplex]
MKEAYYFSHDSNARHDPKVLSMRSVYGSEGYGWYWIIIEMLREQKNYQIEINKYVWNALAMQTQCNADAMHSFVNDCINEFNLFESDGEFFWTESLKRRMDIRNEKSEKARKAAEARWGKVSNTKVSAKPKDKQSGDDANAMHTHSERNALKEKKVKESKVKENKKNISADFVSLTSDEYEKLVSQHGEESTKKMIEVLDNYKGANGKKYKSDYRAILNWVADKVIKEKGGVQSAKSKSYIDNLF